MDEFMVRNPQAGRPALMVVAIMLLLGVGGVAYGYERGYLALPSSTSSPTPTGSDTSGGSSPAATLQATTPTQGIALGGSNSALPKRPVTPSSTTGTITDDTLHEAIPGVAVIVGSKSDKLPSESDLFNPIQLVKKFQLADDNVAYQSDKSGYVLNIADGLTEAKIIAPCYQPLSLTVADLKKNSSRSLKRSCNDNAFFGEVIDGVSGNGVASQIKLSTSQGQNQTIDVDNSGYFTASLPNTKNISFQFVVTLKGFKTGGFKAAIDASQPPSNTWQDITLVPDVQGANL